MPTCRRPCGRAATIRDALIDKYIDVTNRVLSGLPDISVGMHLCRGNRGGQWHAEGSYEAVAEKLFNRLAIKFFFLEYDSPRAGDFAPLRFVPKDKIDRARARLDQDGCPRRQVRG